MASKRRQRRKQCEGKARHDGKNHAEYAARIARERSGDDIRAYRCHMCPGWHIGHNSARKIGGPK
jgi:hypothetical protein